MKEYAIQFMPFPEDKQGKILGTTVYLGGMYIIFIDTTRPKDEQKLTTKHELAHILLNHFNQPWRSDEEIEAEAESKAMKMSDNELQRLLNIATQIAISEKKP